MGLIDDTRLKWHLIIKNLIERTPEYGNKGIMKTYYESLFKEYDKRLLQQPNFIDENEKMFYDGVRLGMEKSITNYANDYLEAQRDKTEYTYLRVNANSFRKSVLDEVKRLSDFENFSLCQNVSVVVEEKFKALVMKQSKEINEKMELEKKYKAKVDSILNSNKNKLSPSNAELFRKEMYKKIYQILKMSNVDLEKLEEAVKTFEVKVYSGFSTIKEFDIEGSKYKVILKVKKDKNYLTINGRPIISDVPFDNLNSKEAMEYMIAYHNKNKEKSVIRNA